MDLFSFSWCCAPGSKATQGAVETGGGNEYVKALPLSTSGETNFPNSGNSSPREGVVTPLPGNGQSNEAAMSPSSSGEAVGPLQMRTTPVQSSTSGLKSSGSGGSAEKARLQKVVREFAKGAMLGIRVNQIDEETASVTEKLLYMDRYLYTMRLVDSSGVETLYRMKDMSAIFKGQEFTQMVPTLSHLARHCMALDFCKDIDFRLCLYFQAAEQRDEFYTCMKILRMSVDMTEKKDEDGA
mmetsp:Transcript_48226/g.86958  ORF Transcript_48226/g.86958 Transcript_48226/m.86958 type:complete len:240 (+) Transcript_48226:88-807(+)